MDYHGVDVSAYEVSDHRIERLRETVDRSEELCSGTRAKISSLHDHKGTLTVVWEQIPRDAAMAAVERAWEEQAEYLVEHYLKGQEL